MSDLWRLGWEESSLLMHQGEISSVELVQACLDRIADSDDEVKAWRWVASQRALEDAQRADDLRAQGKIMGCLHGLPLGVKDIIDTIDGGTEYGSPVYAGHRPKVNAACVTRVRQAGAVVLGKTHTTEFAYFRPAPTRNPQNLDHTPGGSSSGSAAAVAAHMVPVAFGTQTAASVIRPASFCGVVGYKASWGEFSLSGIKPFAHSLDSLGVLARDVNDVQRLRSALTLSAADSRANGVAQHVRADPRTLNIWVCHGPHWDQADADTHSAIFSAANLWQDAGASVKSVDLPDCFELLTAAQKTIMACEAAQSLGSEYHAHAQSLSPQIRELIETGLKTSWSEYHQAQALAHRCRIEFAQWLGQGCLLLTPSAMGQAPAGLHATGDPLFSRMWTLLHLPSLSLPWYRGSQGLPVGVQLVGAYAQDDQLLELGTIAHRLLRS